MTDYLGRDLQNEDCVVVIRFYGTSAEFCKCKIIGFTDKFVRVTPQDSKWAFLVTPRKVVKVKNDWL